MRLLPAVFLASLGCSAFGQNYTISTFAGGALPVNIAGSSASLYGPQAVVVDKTGNIFFVDQNDVLRLDATTHVLTLVAGNGLAGFSGDNGPATSAQLNGAWGVAVDSAGNLYIADTQNNRIRKVSNGVITTVAGGGAQGVGSFGDNGPATDAVLSGPQSVAVDAAGNLYIADTEFSRIRKVSNGVITTLAGSLAGFAGDNGPAASAQLAYPYGVAVDSSGNLYIADTSNARVRKISNGVITTVAGNGTAGFSGDNGPATSAQVSNIQGVAVDSAGNLYIADTGNARVRKVSNGVITTVAGNGTPGTSGDNGPASSAQLVGPWGVAVDSAGNLYVADYISFDGSSTLVQGNRIRKVSSGVITTVAGGGTQVGDNGPAAGAQLHLPWSVASDAAGNLYIADTFGNRIRKVAGGVITTVAGIGTQGFSGDNGPATSAQLALPLAVAVDSDGNLYIADNGNNRIRKVSKGVITTVAGSSGTPGFSGDNGPAISAELNGPQGVAVDSAGNLYIADAFNWRIRKVANGVISTAAGNGTSGFGCGGGPATSAQLGQIYGVAVDSPGNLYIADSSNQCIREVSNGVITTVAGGGSPQGGLGDNGPATSAFLSVPQGIAVDSAGNLYIADTDDNLIRKVTKGVITTVAGGGVQFGDNGPATNAQLDQPSGVAVDSAGNVYVADTVDNRIRLLAPGATACAYSLTPTSLLAQASGGSFNVMIQTTASCSWSITGLPNWITVSGASSGIGPTTVLLVVAPNTSTAALRETISIAGVAFTASQAPGTGPPYTCSNTAPPVITFVDSASGYGGYSYFTSGSWLEIKGTNLADPSDPRFAGTGSAQWTSSDFNGTNAPTMIDGISVSINGKPAYVWYLSPTQLNVQAPEDSTIGDVAITVTNCKATSSPLTLTHRTLAPGLLAPANYSAGGTQYMIATFVSDGAYVLNTSTGAAFGLPSRPAKPGDEIIAYGIGFGDVTPSILPGVIVGESNTLVNPVTISFGTANATLSYSGLAGSYVGLYEFYIKVPSGLADGDYQINVTQNGTAVPQTMYLTVHN